MKTKVFFTLIFLAFLGLVACSKQDLIKSPATASSVSGTVTYPKHIALPPELLSGPHHKVREDVVIRFRSEKKRTETGDTKQNFRLGVIQ